MAYIVCYLESLYTPTMGHNNYDDFKNTINNNNITIQKLQEI